jgi:hypothetical protein
VHFAQFSNRFRPLGPVVVVATLLLASFAAAVAWLYAHDRFAPLFDLAMTEMRVRDVGSVHTPLVGLPGRLGRHGGASHPGPLSFYMLAPVYRLLGGSFWALRVAALALHALAIVSSLVIARRRAGTRGMVGLGVSIALLEAGFGLILFTEPWNPNLPVLWFLVFLLSVWSVFADDPWLLPVAAFAGCLCAQTHIPYLAVCGGLTPFALIALVTCWKRARQRGASGMEYSRSLLIALMVVVLLWTPPVIEEVRRHPGNLWALVDYFSKPPAGMVGLAGAVRFVVSHLDAWHLVVDGALQPGVLSNAALHERQPSAERGLVFLALWAVSAVTARKAAARELTSLNYVIALSLGVEVLAVSRIIGAPWHYLLYSCWVIGAVMLFAGGWGLLATSRAHHILSEPRALRIGLAAIAVVVIRLSLRVADAGASSPVASMQLAELASQTVAAIYKRGQNKPDSTYLVVWYDPLYGGAQGIGLLDELERRGLRAFATAEYGPLVTTHRVGALQNVTSLVVLAGGDWIIDVSVIRGASPVAYSDPRDTSARQEFEADRAALSAALKQLGRADLAAKLGERLSEAALVKGLHPVFRMALSRMVDIGVPAAVFVAPLPPRKQTPAVVPH